MATEGWSRQVRWALSRPGEVPVQEQVRISVAQGQITAVEPASDPDSVDPVLAMPTLADAHDHSRGLPTIAYGALDQALETWLPALQLAPQLGTYVQTAYALAKLARSGVGSVAHFHNPQGGDLLEEARQVARAAEDVGIRLALIMPLRDRNRLVYGNQERLLSLLDPADRERVQQIWCAEPIPVQVQIEQVNAIAAECESDRVSVQLGPVGPQWCSDALLAAIAQTSAQQDRRVHMHLFETRYQRQWADRVYPQGVLKALDDLGLLSPRLTVAHGVWLTPEDLDLLAQRGVTLSLNSSSNLRLRSGLAPVKAIRQAGVAFGFGLDGMSLDDDEDALREIRLSYHLYGADGLEPILTPGIVFAAALRTGAFAVTGRRDLGALEPGMAADWFTLDYPALSWDVIPQTVDPAELILSRAHGGFVRDLYVAGRQVVDQGRTIGVDEQALAREIMQNIRDQQQNVYTLNPVLNRYQAGLRRFYRENWHQRTPE